VIFKGGSQANIDLIGGHSHFRTGTVPSVMSFIKAGQLRPIGTSGKVRSSSLPDVPIIADTVPGFEITQWWGLFAPIGTPAPIVERLGRELKFVANVNEVKKSFSEEGADIDYEAPAEFAKFVAADVARWDSIIKEANIKGE
jgi:tripartite-type tricarboxylate transporter receptor subunit TctC